MRLGPILALVLAAVSSASVAEETGVICIAPFEAPRPGSEPPISTTPAPSPDTVFTFVVDKRLKASVRRGEMALLTGVPVDRRVKVEVRTQTRGFETFWLHLGKEPEKRVCLWLYPGYWHWIDNGWEPKLGCKCEAG
jgi:hypothetical protein